MEESNSSSDEPPSKHFGLPEVVSPYLKKLISKTGGNSGPIGRQFMASTLKENCYCLKAACDPLNEDKFLVAPGLVYKYHGRVLWTITFVCASYCRFCTRGREVGNGKTFYSDKEIDRVLKYLAGHSEIKEVILSGGDPLISPQKYLTKIINGLVKLQRKGQIQVIRIGTRLPISNPALIKSWHYRLISKIKNPYLMVHINHPAELTPESLSVLNNFRRKAGAIVSGQTVFLKGVNDSVKTLSELFWKMTAEGIRPYYLYQNDPVYWAKHFTVPIEKAIKIWQQLRPQLSGLAATARFVIDTPYGFGKIPIPEGNAWKVDYSAFFDFHRQKHQLK
jgi:lysine 2,3-aminomutase